MRISDWSSDVCSSDLVADLSRVRKAYEISDRESMLTARELLEREGILAGSSSGTLIAAALRYCREQQTPKRVVTLVCDRGNQSLSKKFNDYSSKEHPVGNKCVRRCRSRGSPQY